MHICLSGNLFQGGVVFDQSVQPHESHIPYLLQFLVTTFISFYKIISPCIFFFFFLVFSSSALLLSSFGFGDRKLLVAVCLTSRFRDSIN